MHQYKESSAGNPNRGKFDDQTLDRSVDQDLDKLETVGMVVVAFEVVATKVTVHKDYSPNQNILDLVVNM